MKTKFKRRLLKLAALLLADARKKRGVKFNLNVWAAPARKQVDSGTSWAEEPETVPVSCHTHACAIGLACISGAFKRQGLTHHFIDRQADGSFWLEPKFGERTNMEAVGGFFGLDDWEADCLFLADCYSITTGGRAERSVAARIKAFVAGKPGWEEVTASR